MTCPYCNREIAAGSAKFCPACGFASQAVPAADPVFDMAIAAGKKPVNKVAYALLALFLGGLGIHKFYAGKIVGLAYLLFCCTFIPSVVAIVEGILAFSKPTDAAGNIYV
jgi:TM2 domain-containing membrane protein YozV